MGNAGRRGARRGVPQLPKQMEVPGKGAPTSRGIERPAAAQGLGKATADRARRLVEEGARLLAARRPGEAVAKLVEAYKLDPQNGAAAINLGGAYILQGKYSRAIPVLEAATHLEPENAMAWVNLAAAYLGKLPLATQEHQEKAIEAYERALVLDARAPNVHYNLGLIYLERRDMLRAAAHFYSALETDPTDRDAQYWLDRIHEEPTDRQSGELPSPGRG